MSRDYRVVPFILFSLYLLFVALVIGLDLRAPAFFGEFGLTDLKVYWAATQVLLDGNNPYQAEHIGAKLAQIGAGPAQVWNPPWTFLLLLPLMKWPEPRNVQLLLLGTNIALLVLSVALVRRICEPGAREGGTVLIWLLSILFCFPISFTLYFGQITLLLCVSLLAAIHFSVTRQDWLCGAALVLLSMKPHVGFLVTAFIVFNSLRERRWKVPVALAGTFSGVVALTYLRFPELLGQWAQKGRLPTEWMGSTLPALLRSGLELSQGAGFALALGISAIALISTILLSLRTAQPITTFVSPLLCLSCLLAPYGFVFDHCPLLLPLYAAFLAIWQHRQLRGLLNVLAPVALALLGAATLLGVETMELMSFLPALVLVLWIYSERIRTGSVRHDSP